MYMDITILLIILVIIASIYSIYIGSINLHFKEYFVPNIINYERGYLGNVSNDSKVDIINTKEIISPQKNGCMYKLFEYNDIYIRPLNTNRSLSYNHSIDNSYVFIDNTKITWQFNTESETNPEKCLVSISTQDKTNNNIYYLSANKDETVSLSTVKGNLDQIWEIKEISLNRYIIKSHVYNTYLTLSYIKYYNSYLVELQKMIDNKLNPRMLWTIEGTNKKKPSLPLHKPYTPSRSAYDFPYSGDDGNNMINVLPNGVEYPKDNKWEGRNVFMPEFVDVWNGNYNVIPSIKYNVPKYIGKFPPRKTINDFYTDTYKDLEEQLKELEKNVMKNSSEIGVIQFKMKNEMMIIQGTYDNYRTTPEYKYAGKEQYELVQQPYNKKLLLNINLQQQSNYLDVQGKISIAKLNAIQVEKRVPNNGYVKQYDGTWLQTYKTTEFTTQRYTFDVKSYGANILTSAPNDDSSIFIEMLKKDGNIEVKATITVEGKTDSFIYKKE